MPARTSVAPWRFPVWFSLFFRFPEHKIQRIFLLIFAGYQQRTVPCLKIIQILMRQFSIILKLTGSEIYRAIHSIGIPFIDQFRDHIDHPADLLSRQRMGRGRHDIHAFHILFALRDISLGNLLRADALFIGFFDNLVVHVCKVGYKVHFIAFVLQITAHRIEHDHRTGIADMDKIINGRSAHVHAHLFFLQGDEILFLFG